MATMISTQWVYHGPDANSYLWQEQQIPAGTKVDIFCQEGTWYAIQYYQGGYKRGYVPVDSVKDAGTVPAASSIVSNAGARYVHTTTYTYDGPAAGTYASKHQLLRGEVVWYLGYKYNGYAFLEYYVTGTLKRMRAFINANNLGTEPPPGTVSKMVGYAYAEVGYKEKASNSQLDNPTANAGKGNYTKYGAWYGLQDEWCAMFVSWCANKAGILTTNSTASYPYVFKHAYVPTMYNWYYSNGRILDASKNAAKIGDIAFISIDGKNNEHVGIVAALTTNSITVIEGNCDNQVAMVTYYGRVSGSKKIVSLGR